MVLTTTGTALNLTEIEGLVDHVNISRHHWHAAHNADIMGKTHIANSDLTYLIGGLNSFGIDATLNCVLTRRLQEGLGGSIHQRVFIQEYIRFAKDVGASAVSFRYDANVNTLDPNPFEQQFSQTKPIHQSQCPVCRSKTQLFNGIHVHWKSSLIEPKEFLSEDEIYELILHPGGKLTMDWAGALQFDPDSMDADGLMDSLRTMDDPEDIQVSEKPSKPKAIKKKAPTVVHTSGTNHTAISPLSGGDCNMGGSGPC